MASKGIHERVHSQSSGGIGIPIPLETQAHFIGPVVEPLPRDLVAKPVLEDPERRDCPRPVAWPGFSWSTTGRLWPGCFPDQEPFFTQQDTVKKGDLDVFVCSHQTRQARELAGVVVASNANAVVHQVVEGAVIGEVREVALSVKGFCAEGCWSASAQNHRCPGG